jgi:hypothetical protein
MSIVWNAKQSAKRYVLTRSRMKGAAKPARHRRACRCDRVRALTSGV